MASTPSYTYCTTHLQRFITVVASIVVVGLPCVASANNPAQTITAELPDHTTYAERFEQRFAPLSRTWTGATTTQDGAIAWSGNRVFRVNTDTTSKLLDVGRTPVRDVVTASDGTLYILRGQHDLTVVAPDGSKMRPSLKFAQDTDMLITSNTALVWVGQLRNSTMDASMGVSRDNGATWSFRELEIGSESYDLTVGPDGFIQLLSGDEAGCGGGWQWRKFGHLDREDWFDGGWPLDTVSWAAGTAGWSYAVDWCHPDNDAMHLCAVSPEGSVTALFKTVEDDPDPVQFFSNGAHTVAVHDNMLYRLDGAQATSLNARLPTRVTHVSIGHDGQLTGLDQGSLFTMPTHTTWSTAAK